MNWTTTYRFMRTYKIDTFLFFSTAATLWWTSFESISNIHFWENFRQGVLFALLFSVNFFFVNDIYIPKYLYAKRFGRFIGMVALQLFVSCTIAYILAIWSYRGFTLNLTMKNTNAGGYIFQIYVVPFFIMGIGAAIRIFNDQIKTRLAMETLQKEKAKTELDFLKAQMNPHFIFNYLNTIYFQINKENQTARTTLLKFSELLRYQLYECNTERIGIEKEVAYLENYIGLQRLRYSENYKIDFQKDPSVSSTNFEIPPLIVVPFIENAFKYVSNHADKLNEIEIKLDRDETFFTCYVRNTTEPMREKTPNVSGGIGLQNVKRRLDLLYAPEDFELKIHDNEADFVVFLKLKIDEIS
jgi:two-component system, LytTR family, sensor kinase